MARLIKLLSGQRKKQGNWNLAPIWTKIKIVTQAPGLRANPHILPCFVSFHLLQEILKKKESLPIWHRRTASFFLQTFPVDIKPTPLSAVLTYYLLFSFQVIWCHWTMRTLLQNDTTAGNGDAGSWAHVSPWLLRLSHLPVQILRRRQVFPPLSGGTLRGWLLWHHKHFQRQRHGLLFVTSGDFSPDPNTPF